MHRHDLAARLTHVFDLHRPHSPRLTIRSVIHVASVPDDGALVNATIIADGIDLDGSSNNASLLSHSPLPAGALKSIRGVSAITRTVSAPKELARFRIDCVTSLS